MPKIQHHLKNSSWKQYVSEETGPWWSINRYYSGAGTSRGLV